MKIKAAEMETHVTLAEKLCGIVRIGARPERAEQFFHLPCPCRFGRKGSQFPEASRPLLRHVLQAIQPQLPRPLEGRDRVTLFHFMFHASNLIHGPVHVTSQVKVVVDDLLCSIRNIADRRVPKGLPHVHRNGLHLFTLFSGQGSPEPIEAVLLPIILDGQHPRLSSVRTTHNGHVLMSPADRLLIHAQPLKGHHGASGESPVNRPLLDPVCLIPGILKMSHAAAVEHSFKTSIANRSNHAVMANFFEFGAVGMTRFSICYLRHNTTGLFFPQEEVHAPKTAGDFLTRQAARNFHCDLRRDRQGMNSPNSVKRRFPKKYKPSAFQNSARCRPRSGQQHQASRGCNSARHDRCPVTACFNDGLTRLILSSGGHEIFIDARGRI